jgi:sarcosine oxidase
MAARQWVGMLGNSDLAVIGGGAFGMWTALCAAELGARVTLVERRAVGHDRAPSGGASRNIRAAYGSDGFYTRLAMAAWSAWRDREDQFGVQLLYPSGALRAETRVSLEAQRRTFLECGLPCEVLNAAEARHRWPLLRVDDGEELFFEPQAGVLLASEALRAVERRFVALGGQVVRAEASFAHERGRLVARCDGAELAAGRIVVAPGPWLPVLLPKLFGPLMRTPRRELFFFATSGADGAYGWPSLPNLSDDAGWTSADIGGGIKVAPLMRHIPLDPDADPGPVTPRFQEAARAWLARRLPGLAEAPLVATYAGQLENTANEHFIIDRHPEDPRIVLAGGGSGHAFKFGPVLGAQIARFALEGQWPEQWRARFALASHRPVQEGEAG